jgi:hypothetical protein
MTPEPGVLEFLENPANLQQAIEHAPEGDVHWRIAEKKRRDNVRMLVSLGALSILAGTIGLTFAAAWGGNQPLTWANWGPIEPVPKGCRGAGLHCRGGRIGCFGLRGYA